MSGVKTLLGPDVRARLQEIEERCAEARKLLEENGDALPEAKTGQLNALEKCVVGLFGAGWSIAQMIPHQHPQDKGELLSAVHRAQHLIGMRASRRANPTYWYVEGPEFGKLSGSNE